MYGNAIIEYCGMTLEADQIFYNTETGEAEAFGTQDSLGNVISYAKFNDGNQEMQYKKLRYNFKTRRGKVSQLVTQQGDGYVRGKEVKQIGPGEFFVKTTLYTTCNLEDPHYYFTFDKSKIKNDKFAAGKNLNLFIKDIPTPLYFPFAIFPLERGRRAGFTRPAPSYDQQRGFNLKNVGWYQPIKDHQDAIATGNFYTSGSYDVRTSYRYRRKYKYQAKFDFTYSKLKGLNESVQNALGENFSNSFQLNFTFNQDPKVWKNANLNASVNVGQSNFKRLNVVNPEERLQNTYTSSINFNQTFPNSPFSLSSNVRYNQNTQTERVSLSLPEVNLSMATIYPFRGLSKPGKPSALDNVNLSYRSNFRNRIQTSDSLFFGNPIGAVNDGNFGARHTIPLSASFKIAKFFTLSPSINYNEVWSSRNNEFRWDPIQQEVIQDTVDVFRTARWYSTGVGLNTRIFGQKNFKPGSAIGAIRHVMTPSLSLSYSPDFSNTLSNDMPVFYEVQSDTLGNVRQFSLFDGTLFGGPPLASGGNVGFSLNNNLEMKVRSKDEKDTSGYKKIKIFESLNLNTSYNLKADSLNLAPITISGNTKLFNKINMNIAGRFEPYAVNPLTGRRFDRFFASENGGLADFVNGSFRLSGSLNSNKDDKDDQVQEVNLIENPLYPGQQLFTDNYTGRYVDFSIPWDLRLNYNLSYNKTYRVLLDTGGLRESFNITNAVTGNVSMNVTPEWKLDLSTGYDIRGNELNYTRVNIFRDLHCWQMAFNWSPVGNFKNYMFSISPKSSMLRDLKVDKRRNYLDEFAD